jgi:Glycosyl transferases group 1
VLRAHVLCWSTGAFLPLSPGFCVAVNGGMNMPGALFITAQSLSPRTALGVQTKNFLEDIPTWKHVYWDAADFKNHDPRSTRIESLLFSRFSIFKRDPASRPERILSRLSWWKNNEPKPALKKWLRTAVKDDVSVVFASVSSVRDGERTKAILVELEKPFVLHLWDLLDNNHSDSESFRWLVQRAAHVFCLTQEMIDHIAPLRADATILRFTRRPSLHFATAPSGGPLRIALIGYCLPYRDGLSILNKAVKIVRQRGREVSLIYIGSKKRVSAWGPVFDEEVSVTGFVESGDERDRLLRECHVGFLPGPLAPPSANTLSKFSIPSRILDFMATGLPFTGTIHPESATSTYMETHGLGRCLNVNTPELLADKLIELSDPSTWSMYSELSLGGFHTAQQESRMLEYWLQNAGKTALAV